MVIGAINKLRRSLPLVCVRLGYTRVCRNPGYRAYTMEAPNTSDNRPSMPFCSPSRVEPKCSTIVALSSFARVVAAAKVGCKTAYVGQNVVCKFALKRRL
jgi:hypothetical protein